MQRIVLYQGGDQAIRYIPLDAEMKPFVVSSASYRIDDLRFAIGDSNREIVDDTVVAQDATSTTLTADSGAGSANRTAVPVADTTGFVAGRQYLLIGSEKTAIVQVAEVDAGGLRLALESKLVDSWSSGDTIRGIELEATFPSAEAEDEDDLEAGGGPYGVDFSYDGIKRRVIVWVRRHNIPVSATREDLVEFDPAIANHFGSMIQPERTIRAAVRSWISDLTAAGLDPTTYTSPVATEAISCRALALAWYALPGSEDGAERGKRHMERYASLVNNIKSGLDGKGVVETTKTDKAGPQKRRARVRIA